jgi:hypothetical protein
MAMPADVRFVFGGTIRKDVGRYDVERYGMGIQWMYRQAGPRRQATP